MSLYAFCHVEWSVTDLERSRAFYEGLFDWKFQPFGEDYLMFNTPSKEIGGGLMKENSVMAGSSPTAYIIVQDVETYLKKATALGGQLCVPKTEIPGMGWFGIVNDPDGNAVGLYQSAREDVRLPLHSFCHIEWAVSNQHRAREFFAGLFNWKFEAFGDNYQMFITPSEDVGGGLMEEKEFKPAQSPRVFVEVEDIEPYLDKAVKLGGKQIVPKTEIPSIGWFGMAADPDGNTVGLFKSASTN